MGDDIRPNKKYALKRINCSDHEIIQSCRHEAGIHRSLPVHHPNLLELLGLKFDNNTNTSDDNNMSSSISSSHGHGSNSQQHVEYNVCYMLFPYITNSLRDEITFRNIISHDISNNHQSQSAAYNSSTTTRRQPFSTKEVLHLFGGLLDAVTAMHNSNISHRDIKLENVLLNNNMTGYDDNDNGVAATTTRGSSGKSRSRMIMQPVLMDFGSAGHLTRQIKSRQDVLTIVEESASHTTLPYRPPELFDGGLRYYTNNNNNSTEVLDYGKVDVWSLGCVLFGLMHGISPYEMEYSRRGNSRGQYGLVRVVECTHLKILDEVPLPPWASVGKGANDNDDSCGADGKDGKYPQSIYKFVRYMVNHDRNQRPNIHEACQKFGELYLKLLGERWIPHEESGQNKKGNDDDFDSLIASRDFV